MPNPPSWTPERRREYQREWARQNRERVVEYERVRREKDPEKYRAEQRERMARYRERNPTAAAEQSQRSKQRRRDKVAEIKSATGCIDCGIRDARVLDFDHRPGIVKAAAVSQLISRASWGAILTEIAKCDVRCANCHRIAHAEDAERQEDVA